MDSRIKKQADEAMSAAHEMGWAFSSAFEDAVIGGKNLSEVLHGIESDILRIVLRKSITEPVGNWISGAISSGGIFSAIGSIFGFAGGGRPPVGRPSMVGENGPELFVPDSAGTIVPNNAMQSGGGGNHYYIDARGADAGVVDRIATALNQLAGPGVVEQRALVAVNNHLRRGGQLA